MLSTDIVYHGRKNNREKKADLETSFDAYIIILLTNVFIYITLSTDILRKETIWRKKR
jgi:hypothetical protein